MGNVNTDRYKELEKLFREVGIQELNRYLASQGHRAVNFERNWKVVRYTLQHGPVAAAKLYKLSANYPQQLLTRYEKSAREVLELRKREELKSMFNTTCPVCHSECDEFMVDVNGEICGCNKCVTSVDVYEYVQEMEDSHRALAQELNYEIEREFD